MSWLPRARAVITTALRGLPPVGRRILSWARANPRLSVLLCIVLVLCGVWYARHRWLIAREYGPGPAGRLAYKLDRMSPRQRQRYLRRRSQLRQATRTRDLADRASHGDREAILDLAQYLADAGDFDSAAALLMELTPPFKPSRTGPPPITNLKALVRYILDTGNRSKQRRQAETAWQQQQMLALADQLRYDPSHALCAAALYEAYLALWPRDRARPDTLLKLIDIYARDARHMGRAKEKAEAMIAVYEERSASRPGSAEDAVNRAAKARMLEQLASLEEGTKAEELREQARQERALIHDRFPLRTVANVLGRSALSPEEQRTLDLADLESLKQQLARARTERERASAHMSLAECYRRLGRADDARTSYGAAMAADPAGVGSRALDSLLDLAIESIDHGGNVSVLEEWAKDAEALSRRGRTVSPRGVRVSEVADCMERAARKARERGAAALEADLLETAIACREPGSSQITKPALRLIELSLARGDPARARRAAELLRAAYSDPAAPSPRTADEILAYVRSELERGREPQTTRYALEQFLENRRRRAADGLPPE